MGIAIPRPQMRSRERRKIEANLARHNELMQGFIKEGFGRDEASSRAYILVQDELKKERREGGTCPIVKAATELQPATNLGV